MLTFTGFDFGQASVDTTGLTVTFLFHAWLLPLLLLLTSKDVIFRTDFFLTCQSYQIAINLVKPTAESHELGVQMTVTFPSMLVCA